MANLCINLDFFYHHSIAEKSLTSGSITACCEERERNGLHTKTWKPTWICYDNKPLEHPGAVGPTGKSDF